MILRWLGMLALAIAIVGCGTEKTVSEKKTSEKKAEEKNKTASAKEAHKHDQWWCDEHGIVEDECLLCKLGEQGCKKKGDWCEMHERPKSQCFKCKPELREFFAAQYRAKYKKEPPPIEDDEKK